MGAESLRGKDIRWFTGRWCYRVLRLGLTTDDINAINMNFGTWFPGIPQKAMLLPLTPLNYAALENGYVKMANIADMKLPVRDVLLVTPETYKDPVKWKPSKLL